MGADKDLGSGLIACVEALQRLLTGKPIVSAHVGLDLSKLTASIVSLEAGFDRGYLKKSRTAHLPLLAQIEAVREKTNKGVSSNGNQLRQLEKRIAKLEDELARAQEQRGRALVQNMKLWERVRELERALVGHPSGNVRMLLAPD
ncbi:hypothetical protein ABOC32_06295 [Pseudomonas sp. WOUb67]|uniref:hypothetical protein n=1 Tax=Pseudomonas sp. WOUb67 TaxID=3161136 RepID=UPI003CF02279